MIRLIIFLCCFQCVANYGYRSDTGIYTECYEETLLHPAEFWEYGYYVTRTAESYGMTSGNSSFDNASAFNSIISDSDNVDIVTFLAADYNFDTTAQTNNSTGINNIVFQGATGGGTRFITDNLANIVVFSFSQINNVSWYDVEFNSSFSDPGGFGSGQPEQSLLYYRFSEGDNWRFERLTFKAYSVKTNGLKIYTAGNQQGGDRHLIDNIDIVDCEWDGIGRFALEIIGQFTFDYSNPSPVVPTILITDINLSNNHVNNIQGYSFSLVNGIDGVIVDNNTFVNGGCALEISAQNIEFTNNNVSGRDYGLNLTSTYTIVNGAESIWWYSHDILVENNVFDVEYGVSIIGVEDAIFRNNDYKADYRMYISFMRNSEFVSNDMEMPGLNQNAQGTALFQVRSGSATNILMDKNNITGTTNSSVIDNGSGFNFSCNNIYVLNSGNFSSGSAGTVTDTNKYVNNVFEQEYGDTGQDCGTIGYVENATPPDPEEPTAFKSGDPMYFLKWINN